MSFVKSATIAGLCVLLSVEIGILFRSAAMAAGSASSRYFLETNGNVFMFFVPWVVVIGGLAWMELTSKPK